MNLRLDQLVGSNWDFRIIHWDAVWGWDWSLAFGHAMASVISDLAARPLSPLMRPQRTSGQVEGTVSTPKRKEAQVLAGNTKQPKLRRFDDNGSNGSNGSTTSTSR